MKQRNILNCICRFSAVLLAVLMTVGLAVPGFALADSGTDSEPIMVSLGDSYSSGEGIEPFYCSGREDRYLQPDWLAHRSRMSWAGKLKLTGSDGKRIVMAQNKAFYSNKTKSYDSFDKNNWYFVASSGAVTGSLNYTQNKTYENYPKNDTTHEVRTVALDNQLKVFESIAPGTTDYVTMTMGGNDAHFADVFVYAALNCSFLNANAMEDYLGKIWDEFYNGYNSIKNRLIRAYEDIHRAAGNQADIIIAGYPKLLPKDGFLIFSKSESGAINRSITKINQEMWGIVNSLRSSTFKIHFVSVEEAFEGHEIYTGTFSEYINGIRLVGKNDLDPDQIISSYSLHPNVYGVQAYADCVQKCIDAIEAEKAQLSSTAEVAPVSEESALPAEEIESEAGEAPGTEPASDVCTLSADLSRLRSLVGATVYAGENSACPLAVEGDSFTAQKELTIPLTASGKTAEICFYKPGCTRLCIEVENITPGEQRDITPLLKQAAKAQRLLAKGDVSGDGLVSVTDIALLLSAQNFETKATAAEAADLNADGVISRNDVAVVLNDTYYGAGDVTIYLPVADK